MEHSHCKKWQDSFPAHLTHSHEIDLKLNYFQITFIKTKFDIDLLISLTFKLAPGPGEENV